MRVIPPQFGPCRKCGQDADRLWVRFVAGPPENLDIECLRCGFKWREAPFDQRVPVISEYSSEHAGLDEILNG